MNSATVSVRILDPDDLNHDLGTLDIVSREYSVDSFPNRMQKTSMEFQTAPWFTKFRLCIFPTVFKCSVLEWLKMNVAKFKQVVGRLKQVRIIEENFKSVGQCRECLVPTGALTNVLIRGDFHLKEIPFDHSKIGIFSKEKIFRFY